MSWLERLRRSEPAYQRGEQYFRRGAVRWIEGDERLVQAQVSGTNLYDVHLTVESDGLACFCDCPHYEDHGRDCKHIWAVLLAANAKGFLSALNRILRPRMYPRFDDFVSEDFRLTPPRIAPPKPLNTWKTEILRLKPPDSYSAIPRNLEPEQQLFYVVNPDRAITAAALVLQLATRRVGVKGPGKLTIARTPLGATKIQDALDLRILALLTGARQDFGYSLYQSDTISTSYRLSATLGAIVLPEVCSTGRCVLVKDAAHAGEYAVLAWEGEEWVFHPEIQLDEREEVYRVTGSLRRRDERIDPAAADLITPGFIVHAGRIAPLASGNAHNWLLALRARGPVLIPRHDRLEFLNDIGTLVSLERLEIPDELQIHPRRFDGLPMLRLQTDANRDRYAEYLRGRIFFSYAGQWIAEDDPLHAIADGDSNRLWARDSGAEREAAARAQQAGLFRTGGTPQWGLHAAQLHRVVEALVRDGWRVEAEGKLYRKSSSVRINLRSGIDWFELEGAAEYDGVAVPLSDLLKAAHRGERTVVLGDGNLGLLPEEWLARFAPALSLATVKDGHLLFKRGQAGLLDALLAAEPDATFDESFRRIRQEMHRFNGIAAVDPTKQFVGTLREYQKEGVGWLEFLRRFRFGGCLADDMGLGKTVQVLAFLDRQRKKATLPTLVVVPKSLVFNWKQEAERFTPALRVADYTGTARADILTTIAPADIVLTTYGTLRKDIVALKDVHFDTIILDEAQAIKNTATNAAKAARLLKGDHLIALTGTPVENHVGELWSLFDFLNPGLLGTASAFRAFESFAPTDATNETLGGNLLARALRPFILRRTKDQVAADLPEKTEQTIYCEMEPAQRKVYNDVRDSYRASLLNRIDAQGLNKSKIHVLEALLRLRQIACHAVLADERKSAIPCAKLDALLPQLSEVLAEGHKAIVFSQFTGFLAILRKELEKKKIDYEYLDGKTHKREQCVHRFQNDPKCGVFVISLKAGGLGLNLTAAEYVFILDPWWNPAIEAQAVDRAHRIGQTRHVFAYRLITKDTVEERVLDLQKSKRELFDAIINMDNSMIRTLTRENLELLLT